MRSTTAWPLATVAVLLATLATPAWGQTTSPAATPGPAASLVFTDETPLTTDVPALRSDPHLTVRMTNLLASAQRVKLAVVGLRPAAGAAADLDDRVFAHEPQDIPARDSLVLSLALKPGGLDLLTATQYSGSIVAVGRRGPIARLPLTITQAPPAAPKPSPLPYPDVTMTAVNYAPSILSPLGPGLLVLGAVALLLGLVWWSDPKRPGAWLAGAGLVAVVAGGLLGAFGERDPSATAEHVQRSLALAGAAALVVAVRFAKVAKGPWKLPLACGAAAICAFLSWGLIQSKGAELDDRPSAALVATKPVDVASGAAQGRVGSASSAEGDVIELEVKGAQLAPVGIERAGSFEGKIDLNGETAGGDVKATVKARDWWPWALLTVALGVGFGYLLRSYFTRERPVQAGRRDLDTLWREIAADESAFAGDAAGTPYGGLSMMRRARARYKKIAELLDAGQAEDAAKVLEELREQSEAFKALRHAAAELGVLTAQARRAIDTEAFGADPATLDALTPSDAAWRAADADQETVVAATPPAGAKEIEEATTFLRQLLPVHESVARNLATAEVLHAQAPVRKMKDGTEFVATFRSIGRRLLSTAKTAELDAIEKEDDSAASELSEAVLVERVTGRVTIEHLRDMPALDERDGSIVRTMLFAPRELMVSAHEPPALRCRVIAPTGDDESAQGDGDDLFELEAQLLGSTGTARTARWTLGDGTGFDQPVVVGDGPATARLRHQFSNTDGPVTIKVQDVGGESATTTATVQRPGRAARARDAFTAQDREMTLLAAVAALGSGMLALYFADGAWGVPKDYLAAVLWGGALSEGVKLLPALVSKVLPSGS